MQVCHFQHLLRPFDKNEPSRFLGEGVFFKAKLIGILEVSEARGDRMCQEALADLKMAIRAAGEHKQRISVHVAIDGLRLRDEKSGDSLYHHPVHKISFIAQDMTDSRAFGYIFGSPDTGHRFFGIKTDKAASQVVIAMRDLFHVVFELKKKEIELAKQQLESKTLAASRYASTVLTDLSKNQNGEGTSGKSRLTIAGTSAIASSSSTTAGTSNSMSGSGGGGAAVAELVDLEQELSSLQRGLHQMERLTPTSDPFGDSFTPTPGILPPPPQSSRGTRNTPASATSEGGSPFSPPAARTHFTFPEPALNSVASVSVPPVQTSPAESNSARHHSPRRTSGLSRSSIDSSERNTLGLLDRTIISSPPLIDSSKESAPMDSHINNSSSAIFDVFTELDPLGTGRSKPYVDKKHFFQELKNPPKKILKDLVGGTVIAEQKFDAAPSSKPELLTTLASVGRQSGGSVSISKQPMPDPLYASTSLFSSDPFAETDPFDNADPFSESIKDDPFVGGALDFSKNYQSDLMSGVKLVMKETTLPETRIGNEDTNKITFISSLQSDAPTLHVSLPPEISRSPKSGRQSSIDNKSTIRQRPQSARQSQQVHPSSSPPPPLPPKKPVERSIESSVGPPLPLPARRRPATSQSNSSVSGNSWFAPTVHTEDDYLAPMPAPIKKPIPSPTPSPGLDITLAQLLTCGVDELADRLRMPAEKLSKMTIVQLTGHLKEYLQTGNKENRPDPIPDKPPQVAARPPQSFEKLPEFVANFEDNFSATKSDTFVANFDNLNSSNKTYDRYAVFRDLEVEEVKNQPLTSLISQNQEEHDSLSSQPDLPCDSPLAQPIEVTKPEIKLDPTPTKSTLSNLISQTVAQNSKLEELKSVISNIHKNSVSPTPDIEIRPVTEIKISESENIKPGNSDRYAALRDLSTLDEPVRPLSAELFEETQRRTPLQVPKERKKSDEKSDGFDHSDFFDCIDNSLSLTNTEDAFRKSPMVIKEPVLSPEKPAEIVHNSPVQLSAPTLPVSCSISDIASGSSPEIVTGRESVPGDREHDSSHRSSSSRRRGDSWALLGSSGSKQRSRPRREDNRMPSEDGVSPWSSDSKESPPQQVKCWSRNYPETSSRRTRRSQKSWQARQTSSSSRDVSPWEEDPPPRDPIPHSRPYHRERRESAGSCERRDSGGSRERRDSGSGRDRDRERDRDRHRRRHPIRDDDDDEWSEEREYSSSKRISPRSGSRETRRDRTRQSDERWRPDDRGYSTVGRRESGRRRGEPPWQGEESHRYSSTMGNRSWRRSGSSGDGDRRSGGGSSGERSRGRHLQQSSHRTRSSRHRSHRSPFEDDFNRDRSPSPLPPASPSNRSRNSRHHFFDDFNQSEADSPVVPKSNARFRFSNDFSEKDSPKSQNSPFENDFVDNNKKKYRSTYSNLEKESPVSSRVSNFGRFKYEKEPSSENLSGSPASPRPRLSASPQNTRSLFEDDFSPEPRNGILRSSEANGDNICRNETIHEGEELKSTPKEERTEKNVGFNFGSGKEGGAPEHRRSQKMSNNNKTRSKPDVDLKKSESVNIFARDNDPFDGDDFFNSSGSEKPKKDNWQEDFASFDN